MLRLNIKYKKLCIMIDMIYFFYEEMIDILVHELMINQFLS